MNRLLAVAILLCAAASSAHDADVIYARLERDSASAEVHQVVTMTAQTLSLLSPVDGDGDGRLNRAELEEKRDAIEAGVWAFMPLYAGDARCRLIRTLAHLRETYVELNGEWACPEGELKQVFRLLDVLPSNYKVVLGSQVDGERGQRFAQGSRQTLIIPAKEQPAVESLSGWVQLGILHIFTGIDHVCFLIALLLVGGTWNRVLLMVTAFTVAHSITLGAAALEVISLTSAQQRWVEAAIALSIVWVAVENIVLEEHRHRAAITFAFGLVHGFGFASVLKSYGLRESVVSGLFGFNLGVELGQAALVLVVFPLVKIARAKAASASVWAVRIFSLAIAAAGGYWLYERVLG